jgi:HlyD family secretion protein
VQEGDALLRLDTLPLQRKLREAEADLTVAEAALAAAQRQAGKVELDQAEADLAQADYEAATSKLELALAEQAGLAPLQQAVADAEVALRAARDQLRLKEIAANQSTIRALEYDLAFYQRTLRDLPSNHPDRPAAQERLAEIERDLNRARADREETLRAGREEVTKKEQELAKAKSSLDRARSGEEDPTNSPRLAHEQALARLERARKKVEELRAAAGGAEGPLPEGSVLGAAQTDYDAALAKVEQAKADLEAATLRAPFAGIVLAIQTQPDSQLSPSDPAVYLADLGELQVQGQVTEMDVPRLALAQPVRITFDAYPGRLFSGQVLSLPSRGQGEGGMTYYPVTTSLQNEDSVIRLGMVANVRVVIGERQNVLTVPVAALVYQTDGTVSVKVRMPDGKTVEKNVEIGLNDGILAEVLFGLEEGQVVLIPLVPPQNPMGPVVYG